MELNLNLFSLEDSSGRVLGNDDLRFFYYDIGLDNNSGTPVIYEDNEEVESFKLSRKLTIESVERDNLPSNFQEGKIHFVKYNDETDIEAFFRHMRNAFAHYHIKHCGDFFFMNDYRDEKCTQMSMIGKIKCDDLFNYCNLLFKQRESFINNNKTK